ncbi:hypothetical protein E2C04_01830 [Nocardioides daphniae]|uniref:DUF559 domain-containing protein n=1 Tax=Nocardioides daphniae TaxID=402297 RepID=A0A4P7U7Z1_9ACTN|nr:hypothetical protein E2C04_01830 [Nocardioides daphniae]
MAFLRVTRGAHRRKDAPAPELATLRAWLGVLPPDACFTHVTAARLLGLWLPPLPDDLVTVVALPPAAHPVRRRGLRATRSHQSGTPLMAQGLPVAPAADVVLALCRDLGDLDALMALDSALHQRLVTSAALDQVALRGRPGAPRLRRLLSRADARSESPWETVLRELHRSVGADVTPQFEVRDAQGHFVARGDLRLDGTRVLHEYDGHHHLEVARQRSDLRRSRHLEAAGWVRRGYSAVDLLRRPEEVLADVDRSLGRASDRRRIDAWHELLRTSALTAAGRHLLWPRVQR